MKTNGWRFTHRDVLLNLLVCQRDGGALVGWRRRQAEAVGDGAFCLSQRLLEVLDVSLRLHLQLLRLSAHCCSTHYEVRDKQGLR